MNYLSQLKSKLIKPWNSGAVLLDAYNENTAYPRKIPLSPPSKAEIAQAANMLDSFNKDISALRAFCLRYKLEIECETKNLYSYGKQYLPAAVRISSAEIHAKSVEKEDEYLSFREILETAALDLPEACSYFLQSWRWTKNNPIAAKKLIASAKWRRNNPGLACYVRQAQSINVDTKFLETVNIQTRFLDLLKIVMQPEWLEEHKDKMWPENAGFLSRVTKRIRMRYLDPEDSPFKTKITDIEIYEKDLKPELFSNIKNIIVIENNTTIESLPVISQVLVIYGRGKGIAPLDLSIFENWNKRLFYFGDLDADGLSCLSLARETVPSIKSLLMDTETFNTYAPKLGVRGGNTRSLHAKGLTSLERKLLEELIQKGNKGEINRLEQEKLPFNLVTTTIKNIGDKDNSR